MLLKRKPKPDAPTQPTVIVVQQPAGSDSSSPAVPVRPYLRKRISNKIKDGLQMDKLLEMRRKKRRPKPMLEKELGQVSEQAVSLADYLEAMDRSVEKGGKDE